MFDPDGPTFIELAIQALCSTERGYDLLAPKFDHTPFRTPDEVLEACAGVIGDDLGTALDLCCGTGAGMRILRPRLRERVVGVDFSHGMLEIGKRLQADAPGDAALEWVRGNVLDLPFEDACFDVATCFGALGHIELRDQRAFIREVKRVLRPGGRFVAVTSAPIPAWHWLFWACVAFNAAMRLRNWLIKPAFVMYYLQLQVPELRELLESEGFHVEVHPIPGKYDQLRIATATRR